MITTLLTGEIQISIFDPSLTTSHAISGKLNVLGVTGAMRRAMCMAKGSPFLGRMSQLLDGASHLLDANPATTNR